MARSTAAGATGLWSTQSEAEAGGARAAGGPYVGAGNRHVDREMNPRHGDLQSRIVVTEHGRAGAGWAGGEHAKTNCQAEQYSLQFTSPLGFSATTLAADRRIYKP